jgi:hypothetical protein
LELRFGIERFVAHIWAQALDKPTRVKFATDLRKLKNMEQRIYELAGRQDEINARYDFMRILVEALRLDIKVQTPNLGQLSRHWHYCSELCHIGWILENIASKSGLTNFEKLSQIAGELLQLADGVGWPLDESEDEKFAELRRNFVKGRASRDEVLNYLETVGVWAKVSYPDKRESHFVGEAIPPSSNMPDVEH